MPSLFHVFDPLLVFIGSSFKSYSVISQSNSDSSMKSENPRPGKVHVLVELPDKTADAHVAKKVRLDSTDQDLPRDDSQLWSKALNQLQRLWGTGKGREIDDLFKKLEHTGTKFVDFGAADELQLFTRIPFALIRRDYLRMWKLLSDRPESAIIFGQPGVGKSLFLFVTLILRTLQGLPTAIQVTTDLFHLVDNRGVKSYAVHFPPQYEPDTWFLVDSNEHLRTLPEHLVYRQIGVRVIQATSPLVSRWKWSEKAVESVVFIVMQVWERTEVVQMAELFKFEATRTTRALAVFDQWGPNGGLCYKLSETPADWIQHQTLVQSKIKSLEILPDAQSDGNAFTHSVVYIYPGGVAVSKSYPSITLAIPTEHLKIMVADALASSEREKRKIFLNSLCSHTWFPTGAGHVLEMWMHNLFVTRTQVDFRNHAGSSVVPLLPSGEVRVFHTKAVDKKDMTFPYYLRPRSKTFPLLDAVVVTKNRVFLLQATLAKSHDLAPSGITKMEKILPPIFHSDKTTWCFVWVVDTHEKGRNHTSDNRVSDLRKALPAIKHVYYMVCTPGSSELSNEFIMQLLSPPPEDEYYGDDIEPVDIYDGP